MSKTNIKMKHTNTRKLNEVQIGFLNTYNRIEAVSEAIINLDCSNWILGINEPNSRLYEIRLIEEVDICINKRVAIVCLIQKLSLPGQCGNGLGKKHYSRQKQ